MILAIEDATVGRDKPAHIGNPQGHTHVATRGRTRARTRNGAREGGEGAPQDGRGLGNEASYGSSVDETISRPRRPQATPRLQGTVHPPAPRRQSRTRHMRRAHSRAARAPSDTAPREKENRWVVHGRVFHPVLSSCPVIAFPSSPSRHHHPVITTTAPPAEPTCWVLNPESPRPDATFILERDVTEQTSAQRASRLVRRIVLPVGR